MNSWPFYKLTHCKGENIANYLAWNYLEVRYYLAWDYLIVRNYPTCEITDRNSKRASGKTDVISRCHSYKVIKKFDPVGGSRQLASPPAGVGRL